MAPTAGIHDLPDGEVVFAYALGTAGQKTVRFAEDHIEVTVKHPGEFAEHLPLLCRALDELTVAGAQIRTQRDAGTMVISCAPDVQIETVATDVSHGPFTLNRVVIHAQDQLTYRIAFE